MFINIKFEPLIVPNWFNMTPTRSFVTSKFSVKFKINRFQAQNYAVPLFMQDTTRLSYNVFLLTTVCMALFAITNHGQSVQSIIIVIDNNPALSFLLYFLQKSLRIKLCKKKMYKCRRQVGSKIQ
jgi:hypothetical protein